MYRMDHAAKINAEDGIIAGLSKLPSEYVKSNVWATFQDDRTAFQSLHMIDYKQLLWASDFPHTDSTWPCSTQVLDEMFEDYSAESRDKITRTNVANLYSL